MESWKVILILIGNSEKCWRRGHLVIPSKVSSSLLSALLRPLYFDSALCFPSAYTQSLLLLLSLEIKMTKKENLIESIRYHPTRSFSIGQSPQTRSPYRLVGSVHLASTEVCFRHKWLDQSARVMITKSYDKKHGSFYRRNSLWLLKSSTLSLECHGFVSSSTIWKTVMEDTEMSKERSFPSQSSFKLLIMFLGGISLRWKHLSESLENLPP